MVSRISAHKRALASYISGEAQGWKIWEYMTYENDSGTGLRGAQYRTRAIVREPQMQMLNLQVSEPYLPIGSLFDWSNTQLGGDSRRLILFYLQFGRLAWRNMLYCWQYCNFQASGYILTTSKTLGMMNRDVCIDVPSYFFSSFQDFYGFVVIKS